MDWALYKTPRVIEFRLGCDVGLGYLLFILCAENLQINGRLIQSIHAGKNDKGKPEARHTKGRLLQYVRLAHLETFTEIGIRNILPKKRHKFCTVWDEWRTERSPSDPRLRSIFPLNEPRDHHRRGTEERKYSTRRSYVRRRSSVYTGSGSGRGCAPPATSRVGPSLSP